MTADVLRQAASEMYTHGGTNLCGCGDPVCEDNWYPRWVIATADLLGVVAAEFERGDHSEAWEPFESALVLARAYLDAPS